MRKIFLIGFKDLRLAFRDPTALVLMLLAPFLLTLGMGFVTGAIGGGSSMGLQEMPVLVVNQDAGELGKALEELFQAPELAELVEPTLLDDPAAARRQVDDDQTTAAVIIPAGFTAGDAGEPTAAPPAPSGGRRREVVAWGLLWPNLLANLAGLSDAELDRTGHLALAGGKLSAQQLIEAVILTSGGEHFESMKAAVES